jgi:hypothetical protein
MTPPAKGKPSIHAKCLATTTQEGFTLICRRSPEHTQSTNPERAKHYDPSAEETWED